jgi:competence protein ComFC
MYRTALLQASEALLSFLYPEVCQLCEVESAKPLQGFVCSSCRARLPTIIPPFCSRCGLPYPGQASASFECSNCQGIELHFSFARSILQAKGLSLELIHRYKYQRALWFDPLFKDLFHHHVAPLLLAARWDAIVAVPLHPLKEREREFNQAGRLAQLLGQVSQLPVLQHPLQRTVPTESQTRLTRRARSLNVRTAFAPKTPLPSWARRIILFDDVLTTGATTNACAAVLRHMGAEEIGVWTLARGL